MMKKEKIRIEVNLNKSKTYFLPLFNDIVPIKYFRNLINTYFWYENDYTQDTFCLLFKFDGRVKGELYNKEGFTVFEDELFNNEYFIGHCDYDEYVLYKFNLTKELIKRRNIILEGKYSSLDTTDKESIISFTFIAFSAVEANIIKKVLYKDEGTRQQLAKELGYLDFPKTYELSSSPYIENEVFENFLK